MSEAGTVGGSRIRRSDDGGASLFWISGDWSIQTAADIEPEIRAAATRLGDRATIDLSGLGQLDTSGAWLLRRLRRELEEAGAAVSWAGLSDNARRLLAAVEEPAAPPPARQRGPSLPVLLLSRIGMRVHEVGADLRLWLWILGGAVGGLARGLLNPRRLRFTSIVTHLERAGLMAVPIMVLMSFLIGMIIAQQGAFQLRSFGAELLVVDLVGILVMREIGVLLTAIMLAGRSGSAYTAEIGAMKMREEIDALTVIGMRPTEVLVLPRIVALIVALPLVTFIADIAALAGGGLVAWLSLDIPPAAYISRLRYAIGLNTFAVGLIKAPFMALIIGIIACAEGLKVKGSAESLGRQTTASVVKAIFMVIVVDGIFAIFFGSIGF